MTPRVVAAPTRVSWQVRDARGFTGQPVEATRSFHRRIPGYAVSPLVRAESTARELGLGEVWVKDESDRLGLPSFKILGASWAAYRTLRNIGGFDDNDWSDMDDLAKLVGSRTPVRRLAAATDGNHGRAVAYIARLLGLDCSIFVPTGTAQARIDAIAGEDATVEVVDGGYGDAVARSAPEASAECLIVSDTSWPGYQDVPQAVIEGYSTIFDEVDEQLAAVGAEPPSLVLIQVGVGALAAAAVRHYRGSEQGRAVRMVVVEPLAAACNLESIKASEMVSIPGPHDSIMVGLNCDTPSMVAWAEVSGGVDAFVAVEDESAREAMRALARAGVVSGETGAAGLAGLREMCVGQAKACGDELDLGLDTSALIISTEGATDPDAYSRIVPFAVRQEGGQK